MALVLLDLVVRDASPAAREWGRRGLARLCITPNTPLADIRPPHLLNRWQQAAFDKLQDCIGKKEFGAFLLQGVTGSGKTEVYLKAIDHVLACNRSALLLVPEIALTPAVAGQFLHRFGDRVAILHSAFTSTERIEQWRRIRAGEAAGGFGPPPGPFSPV